MTFVVVAGPEGAGKSTLVRWLGAAMRAEGRDVLTVREPGGTPIAEAARKLALKSRHDRAGGAELFLFLAARADLAGRGLDRGDVEAALRIATGGLTPDLTLVLDVPLQVGRERQRNAGKVKDRIEREDDTFHTRVRDAYRSASGPGIVHIDASQTKKAVQDAAWREVAAATALSLRGA